MIHNWDSFFMGAIAGVLVTAGGVIIYLWLKLKEYRDHERENNEADD